MQIQQTTISGSSMVNEYICHKYPLSIQFIKNIQHTCTWECVNYVLLRNACKYVNMYIVLTVMQSVANTVGIYHAIKVYGLHCIER